MKLVAHHLKMANDVDTPKSKIVEHISFNGSIIVLSKDISVKHKPVYSLTHRLYDPTTSKFIDLGFSRTSNTEEESRESASLLKQTNLCTSGEKQEFCKKYLEEVDIPERIVPREYPSGSKIPKYLRGRLYQEYLKIILKT